MERYPFILSYFFSPRPSIRFSVSTSVKSPFSSLNCTIFDAVLRPIPGTSARSSAVALLRSIGIPSVSRAKADISPVVIRYRAVSQVTRSPERTPRQDRPP